MTNDYRAMCAELIDIITAHANPDDAAVGYVAGVLTRARALLDQPVTEGLPHWSEGICGDGAAILRDGAMVPIEEVIVELNRRPTPQPPADGEVAELVEWLREVDRHFNSPRPARAADLLQRLESDNAGLTAAAESLYLDNISLLDN